MDPRDLGLINELLESEAQLKEVNRVLLHKEDLTNSSYTEYPRTCCSI
jgi:hypothetical protein